MASACVNNSIGVSPEKFPSYGWLSPRISFSSEEDTKKPSSSAAEAAAEDEGEVLDPVDFEFRLEDPVTMLPADELFSDGKLVPLHLSTVKPSTVMMKSADEMNKACDISSFDPYLFSPKAPRCSSRWKELLGLKRLYNNHNISKSENNKATSSSPSSSTHTKSSLKHFLHRNSKSSSPCSVSSSSDCSLNLPLLKDSDCESVSISSSRLSLSSSSSGHEHEDLPRLSLDSDKPSLNPNPNPFANPPRVRMVKPRDGSNHHPNLTAAARAGRSPMRRESAPSRGVSVDSPRMNSSGKIVFQSLERSSSSPSSFNGGPRFKYRGMVERSYSANVRVTPVLNVPVCSLRGSSKSGSVFGFGQLFSSPQKNGNNVPTRQQHQQQSNSRNRTDRT